MLALTKRCTAARQFLPCSIAGLATSAAPAGSARTSVARIIRALIDMFAPRVRDVGQDTVPARELRMARSDGTTQLLDGTVRTGDEGFNAAGCPCCRGGCNRRCASPFYRPLPG